jgi:hypothetical protein
MEYLLVKFRETRGVILNGNPSGDTNTVLELEPGTYYVTLDPPYDFTPVTDVVRLKGTSVLAPKEVEFA